ncbi:MAG: serine acetyltransferase [Myxococcota bacterium]
MFEDFRKDYKRHGSYLLEPGVFVMAVYRFGRWKNTLPKPARWVANKFYRVGFLATQAYMGCHVPCELEFGELPHLVHAKDLHLHPGVKIGDRVGLMHGITVATTVDRPGVPELGDDVFVGAGACIMGPVKIGDGARIAPNSLVLNDVPAGTTAIGVPARIIRAPKKKEADDAASKKA